MEFSDESDSDAKAEPKEKVELPKKRASTRKTAQKDKPASDAPIENVPPRRQPKRTTTALPRAICSDDEEVTSKRRGRSRQTALTEEPDKLRSIEEEHNKVLDISIEQLPTSDTETNDHPVSGKNTVQRGFVILPGQ